MGTLFKETIITILIVAASTVTSTESNYFGRLIGSLDSQYHGVRGDVYAVDARTIFVKGFSYDGQGEDTVFFAGSSSKPGPDGFVIPNESGSTDGLSRSYENNDLILTLPEGKTLKEVRWMSVWSRAFSAVFGEVKIPAGFDYPRPQRLNALSGEHKVGSDRIYVVDAQTFLIPNFTYDGAAPDAFFWVGKGSKPSKDGIKIPDENGKLEPLRRYDSKTLVLTLPGDITVFDVDWLSIWCRAFYVDFGHVRIPKNLNVPPSLKMLGVAPQHDEEYDDSPTYETSHSQSTDLTDDQQFDSPNSPGEFPLNNNFVSASRRVAPIARRHSDTPSTASALPSRSVPILKPIPLFRSVQ